LDLKFRSLIFFYLIFIFYLLIILHFCTLWANIYKKLIFPCIKFSSMHALMHAQCIMGNFLDLIAMQNRQYLTQSGNIKA